MKDKLNVLWRIFLVLGIGLQVSGCNSISYYMRDPFYRRGSEWDHYRFPLKKPYYAICLHNENDWQIPISGDVSRQDLDYYFAIQKVEMIAVENGLILAYTSSHPGVFDANPELSDLIRNWFILMPEDESAIGFSRENEFLEYLATYDISDPEWFNPDELSVQFDNTKCLPWVPGCASEEDTY